MLEDYNIVHFTICKIDLNQPLLVHLKQKASRKKYQTRPPNLTCTQQLLTKAGVRFGMI